MRAYCRSQSHPATGAFAPVWLHTVGEIHVRLDSEGRARGRADDPQALELDRRQLDAATAYHQARVRGGESVRGWCESCDAQVEWKADP